LRLEIVKNPDVFGGEVKPGQAFWAIAHFENRIKPHLYVCCPKCGQLAATTEHKAIIEADGTVTIEPSLQCPINGCPAHYWIKAGEITGLQ